jgi:hypothetical protein
LEGLGYEKRSFLARELVEQEVALSHLVVEVVEVEEGPNVELEAHLAVVVALSAGKVAEGCVYHMCPHVMM